MTDQNTCHKAVLTLSCDNQVGIVAAVTAALADLGLDITESSQFEDVESGRFFVRMAVRRPDGDIDLGRARAALGAVAEALNAEWQFQNMSRPLRALVMVSKFDHCLHDILYRVSKSEIPVEIVAVASNHDTARRLTEGYGVPYHHIPITKATKPEAEAALRDLARDTGAELIVLARYMQILSEEMCRDYAGRIINIHHSFLPSFKGARPYHQAWRKGVKLIGATAHFVTPDLDEGPIIEQDVVRVTHAMSADDLVAAGRDVERRVLSRAVRAFAERRVLMNGVNRTVVF